MGMLNACATVKAPVAVREHTSEAAKASVTSTRAATTRTGGVHQVNKGDTLYSIAWRYGLDYKALAAWNNIRAPYVIYPDQRIRLQGAPRREAQQSDNAVAVVQSALQGAPRREAQQSALQPGPIVNKKALQATTDKPVAEQAQQPKVEGGPVRQSAVITWQWPTRGKLVASRSPTSKKGIDISGEAGQKVVAAADGEIVYSGNGFLGYGKLIIIKHSKIYLSAYAYNHKLIVNEGDKVKAGQQIATMGLDNKGAPVLHFEIRKNGKPVNPLQRLPQV